MRIATILVTLLALTRPSSAQTTSIPPDLVNLRNGGMLRGTIAELVPDDHVTIVLATGETRTIPAAEIAYAGPASSAPQPPSAPPPVVPAAAPVTAAPPAAGAPTRHRLVLEANVRDVTFHLIAGPPGLQRMRRLCTAPCEGALLAGTHEIALSVPGRAPIRSSAPVLIRAPSTLRGTYRSRAGVRSLGAGVAALGALGVVVTLAAYLSNQDELSDEAAAPLLVGGFVGSLVPIAVGLALVGTRDRADVEVAPLR